MIPNGQTAAPAARLRAAGDAAKTPESGRNGRPKGRFFSSRPVTWRILVIRSPIAFITLYLFGFTLPKQ